MNQTRGIFENFPSQPQPGASPFAVADEPAQPSSPFAQPQPQDSPFAVADQPGENRQVEPGKPAKLPEKRKPESPFQIAEPQEGFGFEPPAQAPASSPFQQAAPAPSPFSAPSQQPQPQPSRESVPGFGAWPPAQHQPQPQPQQPSPQPQQPQHDSQDDSYSIRQLELRAIFGVDREMTRDEILQRARALPGIRQIAHVAREDMGAVDGLKGLLNKLGFSGALRIYAGPVPVEFIREGGVMLAVQTDGGFAPGVRETLMIVARELGRLA